MNGSSLSRFQQVHKVIYRGRCLVILQPAVTPGQVSLKVSGLNLAPVDLLIKVN